MPLEHLTLLDLSDREFLLIVAEVAEADGWTDSLDVANRLDLINRRLASSRLSWLARHGIVEREHKRDVNGNIYVTRGGKTVYTQRWRLTDLGYAYAHGALKARTQQALDRVGDEALIELTRYVTDRIKAGGEDMRWMARRQWRYGTEHRNGNG